MRIIDWSSDVCSSDLRVPLVAAVAVSEPPPGQGIYVRYEYRVLGSHPPTPDAVADAGSPNVADYFRLVAVQKPVFDGSRSEERPVGKDCDRRRRSRWSTSRYKKIYK